MAASAEPALDVRASGRGVALDHLLGRGDRHADEIGVVLHVGEAKQRIAALPLAEIFARPALLEVALRDHESIGVLVDDLEALARSFGELFAIEQDANALARAAPDAPAQLVQLRQAEAL